MATLGAPAPLVPQIRVTPVQGPLDMLKSAQDVLGNLGDNGPSGPSVPQQRFDVEQQKAQDIQRMAAQYGSDLDGFVNAVSQKYPKEGYEMGKAAEEWRKAKVETDIQNSTLSGKMLEQGGRMLLLSSSMPALYPVLKSGLTAMAARVPGGAVLAQGLPDPNDPDLQTKLENIAQHTQNLAAYFEQRQKAGDSFLNDKHTLAAAQLLGAANTPELRQHTVQQLNLLGMGGYASMWGDAATAQAYAEAHKDDKPDKDKDRIANMTGGLTGTAGLELAQYMTEHGITNPFDPRLKGVVNTIRAKEKQAITFAAPTVPVQSNPVQGYLGSVISGALQMKDVPAAGGMRNAVIGALQEQGYDLNKPLTAQAQARVDLAKLVLPQISEVQALAQKINQMGLMGTVGGRWRSLISGESAADSMSGLTPAQKQLVGQFVTQAELLATGTAMTHFGARASGPAVAGMQKMLGAGNKDLDVFLGDLEGAQRVLGGYAQGMPGATKHGESDKDPLGIR
jgi:hypothetical protein